MEHEKQIFHSTLASALGSLGVGFDEADATRMWRHYELMIEANRAFNLTRITAAADAAVKHYADSITLLATPWVDRGRAASLLDVGTGAGFPAVPLAIMCPAWKVTAIDSTGKKARFVAQAAAEVGIANLEALHARAAELGRQPGMRFDLVVLRAVAQLSAGLKEVNSLVGPKGAIVFYKSGTLSEDELAAGKAWAQGHGFQKMDILTLKLRAPAGDMERRFIRFMRSG